jgi:hypothetical protein
MHALSLDAAIREIDETIDLSADALAETLDVALDDAVRRAPPAMRPARAAWPAQ